MATSDKVPLRSIVPVTAAEWKAAQRQVNYNFDLIRQHFNKIAPELSNSIDQLPRFKAHPSTTQAGGGSGGVIVAYDVVDEDTHSWYDNTTYRYTPKRAGVYLFRAQAYAADATAGESRVTIDIRKNGSTSTLSERAQSTSDHHPWCMDFVEMNGTTDYVEAAFFDIDSHTVTLHGAAQPQASYFKGIYLGQS